MALYEVWRPMHNKDSGQGNSGVLVVTSGKVDGHSIPHNATVISQHVDVPYNANGGVVKVVFGGKCPDNLPAGSQVRMTHARVPISR